MQSLFRKTILFLTYSVQLILYTVGVSARIWCTDPANTNLLRYIHNLSGIMSWKKMHLSLFIDEMLEYEKAME